ncbi:hypothetical protein DSO57_1019919 [Entomophthora muscae]|uniref:Uncharacterized protein n=1 Tax=Entomophthora muscae TaxID=34485 RepID=A0ACC2UPQ2_9FUNG|nr:hypothetical protein DSO57_1019919 [Entomophthora muscae]
MSLAAFNATRLAKSAPGLHLACDLTSGSPLDTAVSSPIGFSDPSSDGLILSGDPQALSLGEAKLLMESILAQSSGDIFELSGIHYDQLIHDEFTNLKLDGKVIPTYHSIIDYSSSGLHETRPYCTVPSDVGNPNIPLHERALYYITLNPLLLETPGISRPCKSIPQPSDIPYPYCAAVALAYDYLTVLKSQPSIYYKFIASLQGKYYLSPVELEILEITPLLYLFGVTPPTVPIKTASAEVHVVPSAQEGRDAVETPSSEKPLKRKRPIQEGPVKVFKCEGVGCSKVYKQPNGLKYHLASRKCVANPGEAIKPFKCDFLDCPFSSLTQSGLKQHKKKHIKTDSASPDLKVAQTASPAIDLQVPSVTPIPTI